MAGDCEPYRRHFERKREIFVIRGQNGQCLEASNGKPALQETFGHRHDLYSAAHFVILSGVKCRMFDNVKAEQ